jgi:DNA-binding NarL/FixJ family response regulator/uncharacterized protein involved in exopolysaccharide biosynthesis
MIRVLLAEDQDTIQQVLKSHLELEPDLEVVGTAVDSRDAIEQIEALKPDVVLIDIEIPTVDGWDATQIISERFIDTKVLLLSSYSDDKYLHDALKIGAKGFFLKNTPPVELANAIRAIHKGYFQIGPGLIEQFNSQSFAIFSQQKTQSKLEQKSDRQESLLTAVDLDLLSIINEWKSQWHKQWKIEWRKYLPAAIALNTAVWLLVLILFKVLPHSYTSKWAVKILETNPGADVSLPSGGRATSARNFGRTIASADPRNDYVQIATSRAVLEKAAEQMNMSVKDFGEPEITVDRDSGFIAFQIEGETPTQAQQKAQILYQVVTEWLDRLRKTELERQEIETQRTLERARQNIDSAQEKLSVYRASSLMSADEQQIKALSETIEGLRRQQADAQAQERGLKSRYEQLSRDLKLSSSEAADAYQLQTNDVYKQYSQRYALATKAYLDLISRFTNENPALIQKQADMREAAADLQRQASFILGRPMNLEMLAKITPLAPDPQAVGMREKLLEDLVNARAEQQRLAAQEQELTAQIAQLENRLRSFSKDKLSIDRLERDLQYAEAVFTSTLAKLDFSKESIYYNYPPTQLMIEPSLSDLDDPVSPNTRSALLGGLAGSFLVTTGLFLFGWDRDNSKHQM